MKTPNEETNQELINPTAKVKKPNATIFKQLLGIRLFFHTIIDTKIIEKIGFNYHLVLLEIGLTTRFE